MVFSSLYPLFFGFLFLCLPFMLPLFPVPPYFAPTPPPSPPTPIVSVISVIPLDYSPPLIVFPWYGTYAVLDQTDYYPLVPGVPWWQQSWLRASIQHGNNIWLVYVSLLLKWRLMILHYLCGLPAVLKYNLVINKLTLWFFPCTLW